jgi:Domain of unknown function (DUF4403)
MYLLKRPEIMFGLTALILNLSSCASVPKHLEAEQPGQMALRTELKKELSTINIAVEATDSDLAEMLNRLTPKELYKGGTKTSGVMATVTRNGQITVNASDNFIHITVPVSVSMRYGLFETIPLNTRLKFKLNARVTPDWRVFAEVYFTGLTDQLVDEIGIGPLSIRPRSIVEGVTLPVQRTLSDLVGRKLNEKFPLKPHVAKVWNAAQKPILLDKTYNAWLKLTPQAAMVYPFYAQNRQIRLSVGLTTYAELVVGPEPPTNPPATLPDLKMVNANDRSFKVALHTDLFYSDVIKIAAPLLLDRELGSDGKSVILKSLDIYGNGERLVIKVDTAGSLDGTIYLTGRPVINPQTSQFSVEDLDFDIQTQSMLLSTAAWFMHGTIKNTIQEKLNLDLSQRMTQAQDLTGRSLARIQLAENLFLTGSVKTIRLNDVMVQKDRLSIQVYTEGETTILFR